MAGLEVVASDAGLYLPALDLHLDPSRAVARAFVSHAHADHAVEASVHGSGELFASPETLALVAARAGAPARGARPVAWDGSVEIAGARISIASAGHVLGAAQLVVDHAGGRFVYTGDYQSGAGCTHPAGAPVPCDELAIESTFALPMFRFPPRAEVRERVVAWCRARLAEDLTPVLLAYSLGKGQELARTLADAGVPVVAHGALYKVCEAYEALGVPVGVADGRVRPYAQEKKGEKKGEKKDATRKGRLRAVLLAPPRARATPMIKKRSDAVVAYVSGWASIDAAVERWRAHAGFVLSDHADHDDLVATARATGAKKIYATLGADANVLAAVLRAHGHDAEAIEAQALDEREDATP